METKRCNEYYGDVLRMVRALRGLTVPEIAAKYGMSPTTIYSCEVGRSRPKLKNAATLFRALNVNMSVFDTLVEKAIAEGCRISASSLAQQIIDESQRESVSVASKKTADLLPDAPDPDEIDDALIRMYLAMPDNAALREQILTAAKIACYKQFLNKGK